MGKVLTTILSVVIAVGAFTALWVGVNLIFDQASKSWSKFSVLAGALVGFVVFAIIDGNRALQTIGDRDSVRESLYFGEERDPTTWLGDLVGLLWWAIPGAILFGVVAWLLSSAEDRRTRFGIGVAAGAVVGLILGVMLKSLYMPALRVVPLIAWPLAAAAVGFAIDRIRAHGRYGFTLGLGFLGWIIGTFGVPNLGTGTRAEAIMALTVAGALAGGFVGQTRLPDANGRTLVDTRSRAWIFMLPAMLFIAVSLVIPAFLTLLLSLRDNAGEAWIGAENYVNIFRQDGDWNPSYFDLSNWSAIFGSRLLWFGLGLVAIGVGLAVTQGRRTGRTTDFNPQSGGIASFGLLLLGFAIFTHLRGTIINNLWWVFAVTVLATAVGLAIAAWSDGVKGENVAKTIIFMPMAISFVGAAIIWRFMYRSQNVQRTQTGFLNAVWSWLGAKTAGAAPTSGDAPDYDPDEFSNLGVGILDWELFNFNAKWLFVALFAIVAAYLAYRAVGARATTGEAGLVGYLLLAAIPAYLAYRTAVEGIGGYAIQDDGTVVPNPITFLESGPFNNFWLMVVLLWIEAGFAMVILSAAIKGVPGEFLEAAAIDGADDTQIFWRIIVPQIAPTIGVVVTTIIVRTTKVYDVVQVMTGGNFGTNVLANDMIDQAFQFANPGTGSALAIILFLSVLPIMYLNIRRMQQEAA